MFMRLAFLKDLRMRCEVSGNLIFSARREVWRSMQLPCFSTGANGHTENGISRLRFTAGAVRLFYKL